MTNKTQPIAMTSEHVSNKYTSLCVPLVESYTQLRWRHRDCACALIVFKNAVSAINIEVYSGAGSRKSVNESGTPVRIVYLASKRTANSPNR